MRSFLYFIFVFAVVQLAAQPMQFDFPPLCDASPLEQEQFIGEVKINGADAALGDFVALFDDGGNVIGVGSVLVVDLGTGITTGASFPATTQPVADGDCPANYGGAAGEAVDIVLWDASTGDFLTTATGGFTFNTSLGLVTGPDGIPFTADLFNFIAPYAPLPVELLYFRGQAEGKEALLEWATGSEIDNDYFEVQHSTDGRTFVAIGQVEGFGTRNEETYYDFTDQSAVPGTNYYRLKQIDFDGASSLSGIVAINIEGASEEETITIFPNPVQNEVQADLPTSWEEGGDVRMHIVDMNGKVVQQQVFGLQPRLNFSVDAFPAGLYFVTFTNGDRTITERLMKQ